MENLSKEKKSIYLVVGFLLLTLLFDVFAKWTDVYKIQDTIKFNKYSKLIFVIFSAYLSVQNFKLVKNKLLRLSIAILLLTTFYILVKPFNNEVLIYLFRYLFFFFVIAVILIIRAKNLVKQLCNLLYPIIDVIIVFNFLIIILGVVIKEPLFLTYNENRFGYNGIMLNQMQSPYIYTSFLIILFYQKKTILFLVALLSALIMGVKVLILGVFLFYVGKIFFLDKKIAINKFVFLIITSSFVLYLLLNTIIFKNIIEEHGLFTALTSYRDKHIIDIFSKINNENFNLFFGCKDLSVFRCEFEFVDVFLFFGIFGLGFYTIVMTSIYRWFCVNMLSKIYFLIILIMMFFAGNFFYFPINTFIFMCTLLLITSKENVIMEK